VTILSTRPEELISLIEQHAGIPEESGSIKLFKCLRSHINLILKTNINEFITLNQTDYLNQ